MRELRTLIEAIRMGVKNQVHDLAAAIAYYMLFSIFPFLLGVIAAVGHFFESEAARARLHTILAESLPGSATFIAENLEAVVEVRGALGAIGAIGLLWSASSAFGAITRAINRTLGAERRGSYFVARVRYVLMTLAVSVLIVVSVGATASFALLSNPDLDLLDKFGIDPALVSQLAGGLGSAVLAFLVFVLIYKVTPYIEVHWRHVIPGAVLATVVFEVGKHAFLFYLGRLADFEAVYGSLSSIIVLLVWLYFSALVLVFGAEYNIARAQARGEWSGSEPPESAEPD